MVRVPVPSVGPAGGNLDWVSRPVAPFDGLRLFRDTQGRYGHRDTHAYILYTYTCTYDTLTHTLTHTHTITRTRRFLLSPVGPELQFLLENPSSGREGRNASHRWCGTREICLSHKRVKGCGCRPLVRPQRQLAESTCDFRATHNLFGLLFIFSCHFLHSPAFSSNSPRGDSSETKGCLPRRSTNNYRSPLGERKDCRSMARVWSSRTV